MRELDVDQVGVSLLDESGATLHPGPGELDVDPNGGEAGDTVRGWWCVEAEWLVFVRVRVLRWRSGMVVISGGSGGGDGGDDVVLGKSRSNGGARFGRRGRIDGDGGGLSGRVALGAVADEPGHVATVVATADAAGGSGAAPVPSSVVTQVSASSGEFVAAEAFDAIGGVDDAARCAVVSEAGGVAWVGGPGFFAVSGVGGLEDDAGGRVGSTSPLSGFCAHERFFGEPPGPEFSFAGLERRAGCQGSDDVEGASCRIAEVAAMESPPGVGGGDQPVRA